jgi:hypothetical protein
MVPMPSGETLYVFFKTTCPTCSFSWPFVDRLGKAARGGKLRVLAVSQDDPKTTSIFNRKLGTDVVTVYDAEPWKASDTVGVTSVPTFFLVGEDRVVRDTIVGFQREKMEEIAARAAFLSGQPGRPLFSADENVPAMKPG